MPDDHAPSLGQLFDLPVHPVADLFPLMSDAELDELAADIKQNGLQFPITLSRDGTVLLDGKNRREACRRGGLGDLLQYENHPAERNQDIVAFIVGANLRRRHLDTSQRAWLAQGIANLGQGARTDIQPSANLPKVIDDQGVSQADAAKLLNVSTRSVTAAKKVHDQGVLELGAAVEQGEITVSEAAEIADLPPDEQKEVITKPKPVRRAAVKEKKSKASGSLSSDEEKRVRDWVAEIESYIVETAANSLPKHCRPRLIQGVTTMVNRIAKRRGWQ